jgi:3'-phosphoadenosine 5'-phosphosulfate sulfotransferase (PAPS reductase)/FAD synthetase
MVIVDMAARRSKNIRVFTIDTGRLPAETFDMMEMVRSRYGIAVEPILPAPDEISNCRQTRAEPVL